MAGKVLSLLSKFMFFVALVVLWQVYPALTGTPNFILPTPVATVAAIFNNAAQIWKNLLVTVLETVVGFGLAVFTGIASAIGIYRSSYLRGTLYPSLVALNSFPKVLIAPLLVLWFGFGLQPRILLSAVIAFFPIVINSLTGFTQVEPDLIELCRVYKASEWKIFRRVRAPNSLPYIFDAFKISVPLALIGAVVGEFISGNQGLGYLAETSATFFNVPLTFAVSVTMIFVSLGLYLIVLFSERRVVFWLPSSRRR